MVLPSQVSPSQFDITELFNTMLPVMIMVMMVGMMGKAMAPGNGKTPEPIKAS
jgi:hypothetical protein